MNLSRYVFAAMLAGGMMVGQALAGDACCKSGKAKAGAAVVQAGDKSHCSAAKVAGSASTCGPGLKTCVVYRVGDLETCCPKTAAEAAEKSGAKIEYLAAGKSYEAEDQAKAALAEKIESVLSEMLAIRMSVGGECVGCPMAAAHMAKTSGKPIVYLAVGREYDAREAAEAALAKAKTAVEGVNVVGCGEKAGSAACVAAKAGSEVAAKATCGAKAGAVAGKPCDPSACPEPCKIERRLATARAKYQAALASLEETTQAASL